MREYFSFCGEIKQLEVVYGDESEETKLAHIEFEAESGAQTACLISGALVDERNIKVELVDGDSSKDSGKHGLVEDGKQIAKQVQRKVSQVDEQLGISQGVKRAWSVSSAKAKELDEQYGISAKASEAASAAKASAVKVDERLGISEKVTGLTNSVSKFFGFASSPKLE